MLAFSTFIYGYLTACAIIVTVFGSNHLNHCSHRQCQNGGHCIQDTHKTTHCECTPGYTGNSCEYAPCQANPCFNGGHCETLDEPPYYICTCLNGFHGTHCHLDHTLTVPLSSKSPPVSSFTTKTASSISARTTLRQLNITSTLPSVTQGQLNTTGFPQQNVTSSLQSSHTITTTFSLPPTTPSSQPVVISSAQPLRNTTYTLPPNITSSSVQPTKTSSVQPVTTTSVQPTTTSSVQPTTTTSVQPTKTSSVQPVTTTSVQPTTTSSVQPTTTTSVQPTKTSSTKTTTNFSAHLTLSTSSLTITSNVTTVPTAEPFHYNQCQKIATINDIATLKISSNPNATLCPYSGTHTSPDAFVMNHCGVTIPAAWKKGKNVLMDCEDIPLYTPIAIFDQGIYIPHSNWCGVFLGCISNGFRIGVQECDNNPTIEHIQVGANSYYTVQ